MEIEILYFGVARDLADKDRERLVLDSSTSVDQVCSELKKKYTGLNDIRSFAIAVNESYASGEHELSDGDVLAVIPPVSGG